MSSPLQLTEGICLKLNSGEKDDETLWGSKPTLQFLSIKKVVANGGGGPNGDRYRIIISDGIHFLQAMLATQLNYLVEDGSISKNTVAVLEGMTCQYILEKRLVIILGLRVVQKESPKIGTPTPVPVTEAPPPPPQADATPTAAPTTAPPATSSSSGKSQTRPAGNRGGNPVYPIVALTPYQNNWRIKARVIQKSDIRTYSNQRGDGQFFSVTLMDDSGEIKGTAWNAVVEEFYEKLQENKVYFISKARVNLAKKKFSTITNDYELSLDRGTEIEECHDVDVPVIRYNFVNLEALNDLQKEAICDVIVIVKEAGELSDVNTKNNKTTQKRELLVVDNSGFSVRLTLWGKQAEQYNVPTGSVIAFRGLRVGDFQGRSLSLLSSGSMAVGPDIPEAHSLKGWYSDGGAEASFNSHSNSGLSVNSGKINRDEMRTVNDVKESQLGMSDKPDFFSTRATIMHIKNDNIMYPGCPTCNKKVTEDSSGWRCEKCDRSYEKPNYRYIISMAVGDYTGQMWLSGFNEVGDMLFGMTGNELRAIQEEDDQRANLIIQQAMCNMYNFACRASQHSFNDTHRVRYGIQKMQPVDYTTEARSLLELLHSPWAA
ncbi:replication factor-A protein 1 [Gloeopeniophorella convolvens]|nr:replication factor-A protein 1 [Gloeopeniophorella convolvens]